MEASRNLPLNFVASVESIHLHYQTFQEILYPQPLDHLTGREEDTHNKYRLRGHDTSFTFHMKLCHVVAMAVFVGPPTLILEEKGEMDHNDSLD